MFGFGKKKAAANVEPTDNTATNSSMEEELKEKLTAALGYEIGEPEDGYEFRYDWD